jgi:uncharacterized protein (TIGR02147 family)
MKSIYEYKTYRDYVAQRLESDTKRSGAKSAAARAINCNPAYVSRVLAGQADLSLEQAERLSAFWGQTADETDYFLLLVQYERAGTVHLRNYFSKSIKDLLSKRLNLKSRLAKNENLSAKNEAKYYSSWIYGAIHVLVSIPKLNTVERLSSHLAWPTSNVAEAVEFLIAIGLLNRDGQTLSIGKSHIHLGSDSKHIHKHHFNWRMRTLNALESACPDDLHYSAIAALSTKDAEKIKEILIQNLKTNLSMIQQSQEEKAFVYCFDFYEFRPHLQT